ncbi:beta-ketoacyl synthase chain length factor [Marixanthomonas spongiae]|uniref:3-oxoacyl-ACP synthase n=1 Tax=Marixanthomonas spongiae TaxID=2174845 RepID=A0A2U0HZR2_9FLAO|nr:beta-ketoacyl synthase chain length factor [Marixanthomonas spongiae]PVW14316.1 3-oxoacyl-ACP synthase [Marixanthomonas spongiae]
MKTCYIHSAMSISAQDSFAEDGSFTEVQIYSDYKISAVHPPYRDFIPLSQLRRMSPAVKMGVAASQQALKKANLELPEAIITGSGLGCMADTENFLNTLIEQDEQFLTPTAFIQSTHNTVAGQIALGLNCKAYNTTYAHGSVSFESALIDAQLQLEAGEVNNVLVGGVDELGIEFVDYVHSVEHKQTQPIQVPLSEGATFCVLSSEKKEGAVAVLKAVEINSKIAEGHIGAEIQAFLKRNKVDSSEIDAVILGNNGNAFDGYYQNVENLFSETDILQYKKFVGEYFTASAFAFWMGAQLLDGQPLPPAFFVRKAAQKKYTTVLLYNQFKGSQHSFVLLTQC